MKIERDGLNRVIVTSDTPIYSFEAGGDVFLSFKPVKSLNVWFQKPAKPAARAYINAGGVLDVPEEE